MFESVYKFAFTVGRRSPPALSGDRSKTPVPTNGPSANGNRVKNSAPTFRWWSEKDAPIVSGFSPPDSGVETPGLFFDCRPPAEARSSNTKGFAGNLWLWKYRCGKSGQRNITQGRHRCPPNQIQSGSPDHRTQSTYSVEAHKGNFLKVSPFTLTIFPWAKREI
jgi:hypothetical protein